jgi:hypothetical protein
MKVKEMIAELNKMDPELEVTISGDNDPLKHVDCVFLNEVSEYDVSEYPYFKQREIGKEVVTITGKE